jgi:hypothetical protein
MQIKVIIYALKCPNTGLIRYIGKSCDVKTRFRKHLTARKKTACSKWIFHLKENNLKPELVILDEVEKNKWQESEIGYIKLFRSMGAPLLNHTIGGEGGNTMGGRKLTPEQSKKISLSKIGRHNPTTGMYNQLLKGKKIDKFDLNGNFIETYPSIRQAGISINRCDKRISSMLNGTGKTVNHVGGFVFKYAS